MKRLTIALPIIFSALFSSAVFAAPLPKLIDSSSANSQVSIGSVSVSAVRGSSDDAVHKLQQKAEQLGGSQLHIVALNTPGDSSLWMGNAEVYR
jgi:hypothetical protein